MFDKKKKKLLYFNYTIKLQLPKLKGICNQLENFTIQSIRTHLIANLGFLEKNKFPGIEFHGKDNLMVFDWFYVEPEFFGKKINPLELNSMD